MKLNILLASSLAAAALFMGGCASTGYDKAHSTSTSLEKAAGEVHKGNGQIDAVLFSLSSLINNPEADLKPQFNKFDSAVSKLESLAEDVSERTGTMRTQGAAYFRTWDEELAKIQNEDIRTRSADRKAAVAVQFEKVRLSYIQTKADFAPFMSDLKDIRTALATDLTRGGLASVKDSATKANTNSAPLRTSLSRLESDFKALGVALSTSEK